VGVDEEPEEEGVVVVVEEVEIVVEVKELVLLFASSCSHRLSIWKKNCYSHLFFFSPLSSLLLSPLHTCSVKFALPPEAVLTHNSSSVIPSVKPN
jgi:hypothetical protein